MARASRDVYKRQMLELASMGAQVLHNRSVEMAKRYGVNLEVLSSFVRKPGTKVKEVCKVEQRSISGVAKDTNVSRIALINVKDEPGVAFKVFRMLSKEKIIVDIILQSIGRERVKDISFTVAQTERQRAEELLMSMKDAIGFESISVSDKVAKVSNQG